MESLWWWEMNLYSHICNACYWPWGFYAQSICAAFGYNQVFIFSHPILFLQNIPHECLLALAIEVALGRWSLFQIFPIFPFSVCSVSATTWMFGDPLAVSVCSVSASVFCFCFCLFCFCDHMNVWWPSHWAAIPFTNIGTPASLPSSKPSSKQQRTLKCFIYVLFMFLAAYKPFLLVCYSPKIVSWL